MADLVICKKDDIVNIADAIRERTGSSDAMSLDKMPLYINEINGQALTSGSMIIKGVNNQVHPLHVNCILNDGSFFNRKLFSNDYKLQFVLPSLMVLRVDDGYIYVHKTTYPGGLNVGTFIANSYHIWLNTTNVQNLNLLEEHLPYTDITIAFNNEIDNHNTDIITIDFRAGSDANEPE